MVNIKSVNFRRYSYIIPNDFTHSQIFYNLSIQFVPIDILVWTKKALSNYKRIINSCVSILLTQKGVNQRALSQYAWEHVKLHQIALLENKSPFETLPDILVWPNWMCDHQRRRPPTVQGYGPQEAEDSRFEF